jgi:hypothetical protein
MNWNTKYKKVYLMNGLIRTYLHHTDSRRFMYVANGLVKIKMTSKKYTKYLNVIQDFDNLEFRSHIDVWNYSTMLDKIQW